MKALVTGGAGFIGSHLTEKLLEGREVIVLDNLSSGKEEFLGVFKDNPGFTFVNVDLLNDNIDEHFAGVDEVYHIAANPDVRLGNDDLRVHFDQNILVTYRVLEACRKAGVRRFIFPSSSTVYGEAEVVPTPEDSHYEPISLYGASKLACESLISSYAHNYGMKSYIFRFANVVGGKSTHGVIFDFVNKLKANPNELEILGDGTQNKSYVHIDDCIDAMFFAVENSTEAYQVFNIGSEDRIDVKSLAGIISEEMGLSPRFSFTGGDRGWKGDVPKMMLDITKLKSLGWKPKHGSGDAIRLTVKDILARK